MGFSHLYAGSHTLLKTQFVVHFHLFIMCTYVAKLRLFRFDPQRSVGTTADTYALRKAATCANGVNCCRRWACRALLDSAAFACGAVPRTCAVGACSQECPRQSTMDGWLNFVACILGSRRGLHPARAGDGMQNTFENHDCCDILETRKDVICTYIYILCSMLTGCVLRL